MAKETDNGDITQAVGGWGGGGDDVYLYLTVILIITIG